MLKSIIPKPLFNEIDSMPSLWLEICLHCPILTTTRRREIDFSTIFRTCDWAGLK